MSTFQIPYQTQIRQLSRYETAGEIVESFNLNLSKKLAKINSSQKLLKILDESDVSDEIIHVLTSFDGNYYIITDDDAYTCSLNSDPTNPANWILEGDLNPAGVGFESDAVHFAGLLIISTSDDMTSWDGTTDDLSWWDTTISGTALTANYPHILHVHRGGQETLFVTDKNLVRYYNATAGHSTVTLQTDLVACCVTSGISAIWVGTYSEALDNAYVYEIYVGEEISSTPVARNAYKVDGKAVLSIEVIDNIPYIITERGNLQRFNGAGFETIASLPFAGSDVILDGVEPGLIQNSSSSRPVHPKGMKFNNRSLFINMKTRTADGYYPENSPSGVWEFDIDTRQLTHRFAYADETTHAGTKIMGRIGHLLIPNTPETFILALGEPDETGIVGLYGTSDDTPQSSFITIENESDSITDAYESVYLKAKTLTGSEKIELKYRTEKKDRIMATCTYAGTSQINTTATMTGLEVGDEVTDTYTGLIAHVTSIDNSPTVTMIELDTAIGTDGATRLFEFLNFKPIGYSFEEGTYNTDNKVTYTPADGEYKEIGGFGTGTFAQWKVVMYGDVEYRQFLAKSNVKIGV